MRAANPAASPTIDDYVPLGPLGTALLPFNLPRVLLIDELDKGDIDLPNDLLNVFEEDEYDMLELVRLARRQPDFSVSPPIAAGLRWCTTVSCGAGSSSLSSSPATAKASSRPRP